MKFNIYLRAHQLPQEFYDSRSNSSSVDTGATTTVILFANPPTFSYSFVGGMIIFVTGNQAGLGATISSENKTGNVLNSVTISDPLISPPATGDKYILYRKTTSNVMYATDIYSLGNYVDNIIFDTDIGKGFDSATISVGNKFSSLNSVFSSFLGMKINIEDIMGNRCYEGIVVDINYNGKVGTISCVGYMQTFSWFPYEKIYDSTSTNTSTKILRDICQVNPYINQNLVAIDRNDTWSIAQASIGGIGPIDFAKSEISCQEAINQVLEMGRFGISDDSTYMMIFFDSVPIVKSYPRLLNSYDWILKRNNYSFSNNGFNIKGSIADAYSVIYAKYSDSNNETFYTPAAINLNFLNRFGRRRKAISTNDQSGLAESTAIVKSANNDYANLLTSDEYVINGSVYRNSHAVRLPQYLIRSGDIIRVEPEFGYENVYRNSAIDATTFVVGHTSYNSSNGEIKITPLNNPKMSELFAARIKTR